MKAEVHSVAEHWVSLKVRVDGRALIAQYHMRDCVWDGERLIGLKGEAAPFHVAPAPAEGGEALELTEQQIARVRSSLPDGWPNALYQRGNWCGCI